MIWKLEREEHYFRIFDEHKNIAGYFEPEYGNILPEEKIQEVIESMHKDREKISGGYLMVPMIKFGIFESGQEMDLGYLQAKIQEVKERISSWQKFISNLQNNNHKIQVSHTDQDMLSITFPISFSKPVELDKNSILDELQCTLDTLHNLGLL